jgi:hypothetical protein
MVSGTLIQSASKIYNADITSIGTLPMIQNVEKPQEGMTQNVMPLDPK